MADAPPPAPAPLEAPVVELGAIGLSVAQAGEGGRPLLLLHGFTGAKEDFADWLGPLAEAGWHAVAPDQRGHGASDHPGDEAAYDIDVFAADALALADHLGFDRFVLLGHSMGGMVAQRIAQTAPERLDGLVLMDTSHEGVGQIPPEQVAAAVGIVRSRGIEALSRIVASRSGPLTTPADERVRASRPGYSEFGDRKFRASSPAMYAALAPHITDHADQLPGLAGLAVPCLVMVGEEDAPFVGPSRRLAETIPAARLAVIPEASHSPQFENPDAWWAALIEFLEGLPAQPTA